MTHNTSDIPKGDYEIKKLGGNTRLYYLVTVDDVTYVDDQSVTTQQARKRARNLYGEYATVTPIYKHKRK